MENKHIEQPDFKKLLETLPPVIARNRIEYYLGGLISRGYLQNLDSEGKGPRRIRCGRRIGYLREDLVNWLADRTVIEEGK